jgi:hypothetical protein
LIYLLLLDATNTTGIAYFGNKTKQLILTILRIIKEVTGPPPLGGSGNGVYTPATLYSYDGSGNEVAAVGTGTNYSRRFSPVGQGFMIEGTSSGNVLMKIATVYLLKEEAINHNLIKLVTENHKLLKLLLCLHSVSGFDYSTELTRKLTY